jgi:CRP-like cAMP-binding protein
MQFLRSVPFLSTWRTTVLANLFKSTTERIMTRGQVVYTEGAAVNSIFIIRKGIIEATYCTSTMNKYIYSLLF